MCLSRSKVRVKLYFDNVPKYSKFEVEIQICKLVNFYACLTAKSKFFLFHFICLNSYEVQIFWEGLQQYWEIFIQVFAHSLVLNSYNRQNTRNLYFNQSRRLGLKSFKKLLHFSSVAILSNSQEVATKNATQSSFNKNVSRPIKVQQLVEYTPWPKFSQIIQKSLLPFNRYYWIAICN